MEKQKKKTNGKTFKVLLGLQNNDAAPTMDAGEYFRIDSEFPPDRPDLPDYWLIEKPGEDGEPRYCGLAPDRFYEGCYIANSKVYHAPTGKTISCGATPPKGTGLYLYDILKIKKSKPKETLSVEVFWPITKEELPALPDDQMAYMIYDTDKEQRALYHPPRRSLLVHLMKGLAGLSGPNPPIDIKAEDQRKASEYLAFLTTHQERLYFQQDNNETKLTVANTKTKKQAEQIANKVYEIMQFAFIELRTKYGPQPEQGLLFPQYRPGRGSFFAPQQYADNEGKATYESKVGLAEVENLLNGRFALTTNTKDKREEHPVGKRVKQWKRNPELDSVRRVDLADVAKAAGNILAGRPEVIMLFMRFLRLANERGTAEILDMPLSKLYQLLYPQDNSKTVSVDKRRRLSGLIAELSEISISVKNRAKSSKKEAYYDVVELVRLDGYSWAKDRDGNEKTDQFLRVALTILPTAMNKNGLFWDAPVAISEGVLDLDPKYDATAIRLLWKLTARLDQLNNRNPDKEKTDPVPLTIGREELIDMAELRNVQKGKGNRIANEKLNAALFTLKEKGAIGRFTPEHTAAKPGDKYQIWPSEIVLTLKEKTEGA